MTNLERSFPRRKLAVAVQRFRGQIEHNPSHLKVCPVQPDPEFYFVEQIFTQTSFLKFLEGYRHLDQLLGQYFKR
jgi:hypothetical protein